MQVHSQGFLMQAVDVQVHKREMPAEDVWPSDAKQHTGMMHICLKHLEGLKLEIILYKKYEKQIQGPCHNVPHY